MRGRRPSRKKVAALKAAALVADVGAGLLNEERCAEAERQFRELATPEMVLMLIGWAEGRLR